MRNRILLGVIAIVAASAVNAADALNSYAEISTRFVNAICC
jgi:hypothetical protein